MDAIGSLVMSPSCEYLESRRLLAVFGPDVTFGKGGTANVRATKVVEPLSDGKILVAAVTRRSEGRGIVFSRLNADGTIDTSFGAGGALDVPIASDPTVSGAQVFAFYNLNDQVPAIQARRLDGQLDTSFSGDGKISMPLPPTVSGVGALGPLGLLAAPGGGVFVESRFIGADSATGQGWHYVVAKVDARGRIDRSFGKGGYLEIGLESRLLFASARGLYVHESASFAHRILRRYLPDGSGIDPGFNAPRHPPLNHPAIVGETPDGKVIYTARNRQFGNVVSVARRNANGSVDNTFAANAGSIKLPVDRHASAVLDPQGRILTFAAGSAVRYSADGVRETTGPFNGTIPIDNGVTAFDAAGRLLSGSSHVMRYDNVAPVALGRDRVLYITGDDTSDVVDIRDSGNGRIAATMNGATSTFPASSVKSFSLRLGDGDNNATISYALSSAITSGAGNDTIKTGDGDDGIEPGAGSNTIDMGNGRDSVRIEDRTGGATSVQNVDGGDGSKSIETAGVDVIIRLGTGDSAIRTLGQSSPGETNNTDIIIAGGDNDLIVRTKTANISIRGSGDNSVNADLVATSNVRTGDGQDTIRVLNNSTVFSGGGNDSVVLGGGPGVASINAEAGDDSVRSFNTFAETGAVISGGDGNDTLFGNTGGQQTIRGGNGNDLIDSGGGRNGTGDDLLYGDDGNDTIIGRDGNDTIDGGSGADSLNGTDGNDRLLGRAGNDTIDGGTGNDTLYGGDGNDFLISYDRSTDRVFGDSGTNKGDVDERDLLTDVQLLK
jgi:Ca2+-binding RTX toxin-like protein